MEFLGDEISALLQTNTGSVGEPTDLKLVMVQQRKMAKLKARLRLANEELQRLKVVTVETSDYLRVLLGALSEWTWNGQTQLKCQQPGKRVRARDR